MRARSNHYALAATFISLVSGCASEVRTTVPLLSAAGIPLTMTPPGDIALEVVTHSTAVKDPLPVKGTHVGFADVEAALGHAVTTATIPWADAHKSARKGGMQLVVNLVEARSDWDDGRLSIALTTRVTLRTRDSHEYIAQTQASCHNAGLVAPTEGAPVLYECMTRLGREITGWLGSTEL